MDGRGRALASAGSVLLSTTLLDDVQERADPRLDAGMGGVRVDLVPVRERVFQLYRRAAEPILPESRLWGVWSPRQAMNTYAGSSVVIFSACLYRSLRLLWSNVDIAGITTSSSWVLQ